MAGNEKKRRGGGGRQRVKVKKVQVGDPAVGFVLEIPDEAPYPLPNLTVQVWAECPGLETAHSVVVVRNPTYDRLMTVVVPIGAPEGECAGRDYRVTIMAHYEIQGVPIELGTVTEYQISESGNFKLALGKPDPVYAE